MRSRTASPCYALAHPDRVLGVLYPSGTGIRWGWQDDTRRHRLARLSLAEREELACLEARDKPLAGDAQNGILRLMWQTDFADAARAADMLDDQPLYAFPRDPRVFREVSASLRETLAGPVEPALRGLGCPLVAVHDAQDADPGRARHVADLAPAGRFVSIEDAGHSPWLEQPDPVASAVRGRLTEIAL